MAKYCTKKTFIRATSAISTMIIGIVIYALFRQGVVSKSNFVLAFIKNYIPDMLWMISFMNVCIIYCEGIHKNYIALAGTYTLIIGIIFEATQYWHLVRGTFDFIDILSYFIAIIIVSLIEMKGRKKHEKN